MAAAAHCDCAPHRRRAPRGGERRDRRVGLPPGSKVCETGATHGVRLIEAAHLHRTWHSQQPKGAQTCGHNCAVPSLFAQAEHRREALEAVQFAIDELKARVPIWKREVYVGDNGGSANHDRTSCANANGEAEGGSMWKANKECVFPRADSG